MISASFDEILDSNNNVIGKRLNIYFNSKVVSTLDYPTTAEMSQDDLDNYVAQKLASIFS